MTCPSSPVYQIDYLSFAKTKRAFKETLLGCPYHIVFPYKAQDAPGHWPVRATTGMV